MADRILDLSFSLEEQLRNELAKLHRLAFEYAFGPQPSGDAAYDAFESEYYQIEERAFRISEILRRRYGR